MEQRYNYIRKTFTFDGVRYTVRGKTEEEALRKLIAKQNELEQGLRLKTGAMTVNEWFNQWLDTYKKPTGITEKSIYMYESMYKKRIAPYIGKKKLRDVKPIDLQRVINESAELSASTLQKLRMVLNQLFSQARKSRIIPYDPSEDIVMPSVKKKQRRSITDEERALFLKVEPTIPNAIIFFAMLYTGMRPGELMALNWGDINFKEKTITVNKAVESGTNNRIKSTKTESGVRMIPLRTPLAKRLKPLKKKPADPVFTSQAGCRMARITFDRCWSRVLREMDIENGAKLYRNQIVESTLAPDLVPYCLRHTFCTDLQNAGVPINVAKELMGHADIATTANIYTHRNNETLHREMSKLDKPM